MRKTNSLSALKVARITKPGRYGDGLGLWLQVTHAGTKSWLFRFWRDGRERQMGLGAAHTVSLANAREAARNCRVVLLSGRDPIDERNSERTLKAAGGVPAETFRSCAARYIAAHEPSWRSPTHRAQWKATLEAYVYPILGDLPVQNVDVGAVLNVIEPVWTKLPETAKRLRGRIEAVIDWATARGYRSGENPARWRGHLDKLLPPRSRVAPVQHHPAMAGADVPAFMTTLAGIQGAGARALEFTILTAARTGETLGAKWIEIDLLSKIWTVPAERMKAGRLHRVPLSDRAVLLLRSLPREGEFVFQRNGETLSTNAMLQALHRGGRPDVTVHGFRSTFRDWTAETTTYPRDVAEMALAHSIPNDVEAAYRRGDLLEKRRQLMSDWSQHCGSFAQPGGTIARLQMAARA